MTKFNRSNYLLGIMSTRQYWRFPALPTNNASISMTGDSKATNNAASETFVVANPVPVLTLPSMEKLRIQLS